MKNWKKLLVLLLALVTVFAFAACNKEEPEETDPTLNPGDKNCEHVFTEWEITKENSCTKKGKQERECEKCGKEEEVVLLAYGHTYYGGTCSECGKEAKECEHPETDTVVMSKPTCTEDGEERLVCKLCKAVVDVDYVSAFWHSETENVVVNEATCTENGLEQKVCKLCGKVVDEFIKWATWHIETETVVVAKPTCTENGEEQIVCKTCGEVTNTYTLWATGHENTERVVIKEPTCTESGAYQNVCTLCGGVDYEGTIRAQGHTWEYIDAKNPTCTEVGWYNYRKCTVCAYLYNYSERPATGHNYRANTCKTCEYVNPDFVMATAPGIVEKILPFTPVNSQTYAAEAAKIEKYVGDINVAGQEDFYTLEAAVNGTYCIQLKEVYSGKNFDLYLINALGKVITSDTYCVNGDYIYAELEAGTYTIKLKQDVGYSTYELYVYHKKPIVDVSSYDVISDRMEFPKQIINYYFTPAVSGVYGFTFSEILNNADLVIGIYNHLGEQLFSYDRGNGNTAYATLQAGEKYKIRVYNDDDQVTPFVLTVGKARATVNMNGYTGAEGVLTFAGQEDYFTFVAADSSYSIVITGNTADLKLYLINSLGEQLQENSYCGNAEGITVSNLTVGEVYTIRVARRYDNVNYTLHLYSPKAAYAMTSEMGVRDTIEYMNQKNTYTFTATRAGAHKVMLLIHAASHAQMHIRIYDAEGKEVYSNNYFYDGNYYTLENLEVGSQYTICISIYSGTADYTLSVQP